MKLGTLGTVLNLTLENLLYKASEVRFAICKLRGVSTVSSKSHKLRTERLLV